MELACVFVLKSREDGKVFNVFQNAEFGHSKLPSLKKIIQIEKDYSGIVINWFLAASE